MKYLTLIICILFTTLLAAQDQNNEIKTAIEKIALQYKMNDTQKAELRVIMNRKNEALKKVQSERTNKEKYSSQIVDIVKEYDRSFEAMLNEEQRNMHKMYKSMHTPVKRADEAATVNEIQPVNKSSKSDQ